jgi:hypothetical protein
MLLAIAAATTCFAESPETSRPGSPGEPTEVLLSVFVLDVDDINSAAQKFTANVYVTASWQDPRLAHSGNGRITRSLVDVWSPRLQVANAQKIFMTMPKIVEIAPDGTVFYRQRGWGDYSQPLELQEFPFDTQTFMLKIVSVGYTDQEIRFVESEENFSGLADEFSEPAWKVLGFQSEARPYAPVAGAPSAAGYFVSFTAKRDSSYYIQRILIPLIVIVMASWLIFWVDPQEAGQIGVAMTAMLTLIAYRFMISGLLPKIAYLTRLDIFVLAATLLIFATLLEAVACTVLVRRDKVEAARSLDKVSRVLFPLLFIASGWVAFG